MARIHLGAAELDWLAALPDAVHEVEPHPWCELQAGHPGPHAALGQTAEATDWWVRWTLAASEIVALATCPAAGVPKDRDTGIDGDEVCTLFDGHPGAHSFELPDHEPPEYRLPESRLPE